MILDDSTGIPIWKRSPFQETISDAMFQFWNIASNTPDEAWDANGPALLHAARQITGLIARADLYVRLEEYKAAQEDRGVTH